MSYLNNSLIATGMEIRAGIGARPKVGLQDGAKSGEGEALLERRF